MTEEGIGAVNPKRRRTWIPIHQAHAHVSRFARRKRRNANTATTARTTQIFIVSLSQGQLEPTLLRAPPKAEPALRLERQPGRKPPAPVLRPVQLAARRRLECSSDG